MPFFFLLFLQSQKIKCNVATSHPPAAPEPRPGPGCLPLPGHLTRAPRAEQHGERDISASASSLVDHEHHRTLPSPPRARGWSWHCPPAQTSQLLCPAGEPGVGSGLAASICSRRQGSRARRTPAGTARQRPPALARGRSTLLLGEAQPPPSPAEGSCSPLSPSPPNFPSIQVLGKKKPNHPKTDKLKLVFRI